MTGNRRKLQHYIPQFHLREFSRKNGNNSQVFCFDKKTGKAFLVAVDKIGAEKYFYDVDEGQEVETVFSELEGKMSGAYRSLLQSEDVDRLSKEDKIGIASLIATQHMRTRDFRNTIIEAAEYMFQGAKGAENAVDEHALEELVKFTEEKSAKRLQFTLIANSVSEFAASLFQMKWILFINETEIPFWCSDNPFTNSNIFHYDKYDGLGFERRGSQTHFPLNSRLSLEIVDPVAYCSYPSVLHIDDLENIIFNNHLQVKNANRYIFSSTDDFSLIEKMLEKNPKLGGKGENRFISETRDSDR